MEKMKAHELMHNLCVGIVRKHENEDTPPVSSSDRVEALRVVRASRSLTNWLLPLKYSERAKRIDRIAFAIARGKIPKDEAYEIVLKRQEFIPHDKDRDQRLFSRCDFMKNTLYGLPGDEELAKQMGFSFFFCY